MSNSLDPDQARLFVGPDLGPNCLQRLSADNIGRQKANIIYIDSLSFASILINIYTIVYILSTILQLHRGFYVSFVNL